MVCPFCKMPMEKGALYNARRELGLIWLPDEAPLPWIFSAQKVQERKGLMLDDSTSVSFHGSHQTTYICRACAKGVFDIDGL